MTYETYFIKKLGNEIWPVYLILQKKTFCQKFAEIQKLSISIIMNKLPKEIKLQISRIMPATEEWKLARGVTTRNKL